MVSQGSSKTSDQTQFFLELLSMMDSNTGNLTRVLANYATIALRKKNGGPLELAEFERRTEGSHLGLVDVETVSDLSSRR
jgi:hypothetical protein